MFKMNLSVIRPFFSVCNRSILYQIKSRALSNIVKPTTIQILKEKCTPEDEAKILKHFNESTLNNLIVCGHQLNLTKAMSITEHRLTHGRFMALEDILKVDGIGIQSLNNICNAIKVVKDIETLYSSKSDRAFYPVLTKEQINGIQSIVALDVRFDRVTWAFFNRDLELQEWSATTLFDKPGLDPLIFAEKLEILKNSLPQADVYIVEYKIMRVTAQYLTRAINYHVSVTMLVTLLHMLNSLLVRCKPTTISRYFDLQVANERVSGVNLVRRLLKHNDNNICYISPQMKEIFLSANNLQQDYFTNSLLLGICFHMLVLQESELLEDTDLSEGAKYNKKRMNILSKGVKTE